MNILLTGASSFTGYWFAHALATAGHRVVAPLRSSAGHYEGIRAERVQRLASHAALVENCPFGSAPFFELARREPWDLLAHHAAETANYRSTEFDLLGAVVTNTNRLPAILHELCDRGLRGVVLTGSVFEQDEGAGNSPMAAFSGYGLSKGLTAQVFRYWCGKFAVPIGKFVVPNPFGPFEEPRFCHYMIRAWLNREIPRVQTPRYVRDNIHVDLLSRLYAGFVVTVVQSKGMQKLNPSLYPESQGAFALRLAAELGPRLGVATPIDFADQTEFPEPAVRINTDLPAVTELKWSESAAWDAIASYYLSLSGKTRS